MCFGGESMNTGQRRTRVLLGANPHGDKVVPFHVFSNGIQLVMYGFRFFLVESAMVLLAGRSVVDGGGAAAVPYCAAAVAAERP